MRQIFRHATQQQRPSRELAIRAASALKLRQKQTDSSGVTVTRIALTVRLLFALFSLSLSGGCAHDRPPDAMAAVAPFQQYLDPRTDWSAIQRVVLMPLANQTATTRWPVRHRRSDKGRGQREGTRYLCEGAVRRSRIAPNCSRLPSTSGLVRTGHSISPLQSTSSWFVSVDDSSCRRDRNCDQRWPVGRARNRHCESSEAALRKVVELAAKYDRFGSRARISGRLSTVRQPTDCSFTDAFRFA